jgi:hypothetical protein
VFAERIFDNDFIIKMVIRLRSEEYEQIKVQPINPGKKNISILNTLFHSIQPTIITIGKYGLLLHFVILF